VERPGIVIPVLNSSLCRQRRHDTDVTSQETTIDNPKCFEQKQRFHLPRMSISRSIQVMRKIKLMKTRGHPCIIVFHSPGPKESRSKIPPIRRCQDWGMNRRKIYPLCVRQDARSNWWNNASLLLLEVCRRALSNEIFVSFGIRQSSSANLRTNISPDSRETSGS